MRRPHRVLNTTTARTRRPLRPFQTRPLPTKSHNKKTMTKKTRTTTTTRTTTRTTTTLPLSSPAVAVVYSSHRLPNPTTVRTSPPPRLSQAIPKLQPAVFCKLSKTYPRLSQTRPLSTNAYKSTTTKSKKVTLPSPNTTAATAPSPRRLPKPTTALTRLTLHPLQTTRMPHLTRFYMSPKKTPHLSQTTPQSTSSSNSELPLRPKLRICLTYPWHSSPRQLPWSTSPLQPSRQAPRP